MDSEVLVIGAGIAGFSAAIHCDNALIIEKGTPNTEKAQGGIAAALGEEDNEEIHLEDTLNAGAGLCDENASRVMVEQGPKEIKDLISAGLVLDREPGMEGAHSKPRVLHFGDHTGEQVLSKLRELAEEIPKIEARVTGLLLSEGVCSGVVLENSEEITANSVILATGGFAGLYSKHTNPSSTVGDGVALAFKAGAELMDLEFVQFHPTVFDGFLISESLRGRGALLLNEKNERFVDELAGRDVVSRAMYEQLLESKVFLDARKIPEEVIRNHFSNIYNTCLDRGFDLTKDLLPVEPAAHYTMGGVRTDLDGRTSIKNLFACGEVACTGAHGANRIGSNSLLEGLVFGVRSGKAASRAFEASKGEPVMLDEKISDSTRQTLWEYCGIVRNEKLLKEGLSKNPEGLAELVLKCALARDESRGAHYREDCPHSKSIAKHSFLKRDSDGVFFRLR